MATESMPRAATMVAFDERAHRFRIALDWLRTQSSEHDDASLLDLGCHDGTLCRAAAEALGRATGVDVYDPAAQAAEADQWSYRQRDLNAERTLPFDDESFTAVTALEFIEHVIDTDLLLREIHRVLAPGGLLVISTPNINMLKNRLRVPLGLYPWGLEYRTVVHHVRLYNLGALRDHLEQSGFIVKRARGTHLLPQRLLTRPGLYRISEFGARRWPTLSSNLMVLAEKV